MVRTPRRILALLLLVLFTASLVTAQGITDVPDLATATETSEDSDTATSASSAESTAESTGDATTTDDSAATTTAESTAESTGDSDSTSVSSFDTTGNTATSTGTPAIDIGAVPTIAGAGVPEMVVPYTADAPFMQHSKLPEGTVFIVIGAILAFLGACVLTWRLLVAWSINRSVRKSAMASIRSSEKVGSTPWGGNGGYNPIHKETGSVMSLDALNSAGKPLKSHFKDNPTGGASPTANLFFSPTAQARNDNAGSRPLSDVYNNRSSTFLPAGYYSSTAAHPAGGAGTTTMGGNLAPHNRHSTFNPSPPASPGLHPQSRGSGNRAGSRDGPASARNSYLDVSAGGRQGQRSSAYMSHPSDDNLPGSRAPSAYLEDLFENHGHGPRERF